MSDVIIDTIIPLAGAALIGLFVGWLLWSWRHRRVSPAELGRLTEQSADDAARIRDLETERDRLETRASTLSSELDETAIRLATATGQLEGANAELADLAARSPVDDRVTELQTQLDLAEQRIASLRGEVYDQRKAADTLQKQLTAGSDVLEKELKDVTGKARRLSLDLNDAKASVANLKADRDAARTEAAQLQQALTDRERRIVELEAATTAGSAAGAFVSTDLFSPTGPVPHLDATPETTGAR